MSSSNESVLFSRRLGQMTWFEKLLIEFPESLIVLGSELTDYLNDGDEDDIFPCPDEASWFTDRGCKFPIHCIGQCELCITQFLLDPKAYQYTTLGDIDDPFLATEISLAT